MTKIIRQLSRQSGSTYAFLIVVHRSYIQTSEPVLKWCHSLDITKSHSTPYHPQGNRVYERFNQTLTQLLRDVAHENHRKWAHYLSDVVYKNNYGGVVWIHSKIDV